MGRKRMDSKRGDPIAGVSGFDFCHNEGVVLIGPRIVNKGRTQGVSEMALWENIYAHPTNPDVFYDDNGNTYHVDWMRVKLPWSAWRG